MKIKIGGIVQNGHLARISVLGVPNRPDTAARLLDAFGHASISIQFIIQCIDHNKNEHIVVCVDRKDLERALEVVCHIQGELCASATAHDPNIASVGIFGPDFRLRAGIAGPLFLALAQAGIDIQAISTSISTASAIIPADRLQDALAIIRETFELP